MKTMFFLSVFLFVNSCKTGNENVTSDSMTKVELTTNANGYTPKEADFTAKVSKNATLTIKKHATGMLYPVVESGDNMVVEFTFLKKGAPGTADANYSETLSFEIPSNATKVDLEGSDLLQTKLHYGKHCYCPDAGYYKVSKGSLSIVKTDKELTFNVSFVIDEVSQKLKRVTRTIQL